LTDTLWKIGDCQIRSELIEVRLPFCERLVGQFRRSTHHETFNTLKTQGYHLEHNYGHGKQLLATNLACLTFSAFLINQVAMETKGRLHLPASITGDANGFS
ncbi:MAG: hypothetical protein ACPG5T_04095, partial [Endozoicomonas sp.]